MRRLAILAALSIIVAFTAAPACRRRVNVRPEPAAPLVIEKEVFAADQPAFDNPGRIVCVHWKIKVQGKDSSSIQVIFRAAGSNVLSYEVGTIVNPVDFRQVSIKSSLANEAVGERNVVCTLDVMLNGRTLAQYSLIIPASFPPGTPTAPLPTPLCPPA